MLARRRERPDATLLTKFPDSKSTDFLMLLSYVVSCGLRVALPLGADDDAALVIIISGRVLCEVAGTTTSWKGWSSDKTGKLRSKESQSSLCADGRKRCSFGRCLVRESFSRGLRCDDLLTSPCKVDGLARRRDSDSECGTVFLNVSGDSVVYGLAGLLL